MLFVVVLVESILSLNIIKLIQCVFFYSENVLI